MAADKNLFTVGELSDITGVSKQAIRYYDKIGLLRPGKVDAQNSYRYYEPMHILLLNTITRLSQLGCSLKEIKKYISGGDLKDTSGMLEIRRSLTEKKIAELNNALKTIERQITMIDNGASAGGCEHVVLKQFPVRYYLYVESNVRPDMKHAILQVNRMIRKMDEQGTLYVCSPVFEYIKGKEVFRSGFFYDETPESPFFPAETIPAGTYACAFHRGGYEDMARTTEILEAYIAQNHLEAKSDLYQFYLIDYALTQIDDELLTELQIRIE